MLWQTSRFQLDLSTAHIMGIVNVTPDSFASPSTNVTQAIARCEHLISEGAHILDIGGESSRPGAQPVPLEEEQRRVLPVLKEAVKLGVPISVDTYKPELMQQALDLGADIINDIWALRQPDALKVIAAHPACGVCLMHMHREPLSMQVHPMQGDVVLQVKEFLHARTQAVEAAGVQAQRIAWDPGIGFGKTVDQNFDLLERQTELVGLGYPLLVGWSRKSSLGALTGLSHVEERASASVVAAVLAWQRGARLLRVHDVRQTNAGLAVVQRATGRQNDIAHQGR